VKLTLFFPPPPQGLFQKKTVRQLIEKVAPLLCHPGLGIRYGVISFISATSNPKTLLFSPFEVQALIAPVICPFLKRDLAELNEASLLGFLSVFLFSNHDVLL